MIAGDNRKDAPHRPGAATAAVAQGASPSHVDEDVFVCEASLTQDGLWYIDQVDPGRATYNVPMAFELVGQVDWQAFKETVDTLVARHESLRTSFAARNGTALQVISPSATVKVDHVSLAGGATPLADVEALIADEARRPFDLSTAPLLRVRAFSVSEVRHFVTFVFHHIIADGWSIAVFFREFGEAYASRARGGTIQLPPIAIDYADFSIWQRRRLTSELQAAQLTYWRDNLSGAPDSIALPTDRTRPASSSSAGSMEWYSINAETTARLRELCRAEHTTLFMTVVAALNVLLARHTGVYDIVIGTPMAGRVRQELESTVGFFANTLVLRNTFAPDQSFRQLLQYVRTTTLGAYQHADVPFHQVVGAVRPGRTGVAHPLFQVMCAFQSVPNALLQLPDLEVRSINVTSGTSKFDFLFEFQERRLVIDGSLEYSSELFDLSTVRRWIDRFVTLLDSAVQTPDQPIATLSIVPSQEREQIDAWSAPEAEVSELDASHSWSSIHDAFEQQARQTPTSTAAIFGDERLTYHELSTRSNQLARHLTGIGVGRGSAIGLCMDRSLDLIIAVLGILKAGACYVPLDPAYPAQRLSLMASDAQLQVIVTSGVVSTNWVADSARVVHLDREDDVIRRFSDGPSQIDSSPEDLAYIIYTSGSTGRPKGVAMPHGPLLNLLRWQLARSSAGRGSRTLQFAPISFDVSFQEILATLTSGGCLVLISDDDRRDSHRLLAVLKEQRVNRLFAPFVALQALCEAAQSSEAAPKELTEVITAGEQLQITPSLTAFFNALPQCTLDNHYGPTESHVVTAFRLEGRPDQWPVLPPIGRPIANARAHVLDDRGAPVPIGVPGELYLGGAVLAQGYYRNLELTDDRFVLGTSGSRLYRTGDAARWRPDGTLEFLGRLDTQVKIRGHRIELGEIEAMLCAIPGIENAAVTAIGDDAAVRRLVGYFVAPAATLEVEQIRQQLRALLPEYMVPATFVQLDRLPLTPSGKVERRSLPAPAELAPVARHVSRPASTPTEQQLARIWSELLNLESVGVDESFFNLGGHSLLAVKMFSRIHDAWGRSIPFSTLLQRPTIADLAELIDARSPEAGRPSCIVPLRVGGSRPPIFFVHGLGAEVWTFVELAKRLGPEQVVYGIQPVEGDAAPKSIAGMAELYVSEIEKLVPNGPYILGGFCSGAVTAFEIARQLRISGKTVDLLVVFDYWFDEVPAGVGGFLRNFAFWIGEDLLHTSLRNNIGRIRSKGRQLRSRVLQRLGVTAAAEDVRDQLGMWRYPDHEVQRLRSFFDAMLNYEFVPYDGAIHVFRARTRRLWGRHPSEDMGWSRVATGSLKVETVPGSHDTMFQEPFVNILARRLESAIRTNLASESTAFKRPTAEAAHWHDEHAS